LLALLLGRPPAPHVNTDSKHEASNQQPHNNVPSDVPALVAAAVVVVTEAFGAVRVVGKCARIQ